MPGPAHHRDLVPELPPSGAQLLAHVGLADQVACVAAVPVRLAQRRHGFAQDGERAVRIGSRRAVAVLHDVLPPGFRVVVSGGFGEHADGVDPQRGPLVRCVALGFRFVLRAFIAGRQGVGRREVDEADLGARVQGPAQRHPLRGELGHRPERGPARVVHHMGEQRDRRPHVRVGGEREQPVGLGRALDEHGPGARRLQRRPHGPRRPGPVVAHAEQPGAGGAAASGAAGDRRVMPTPRGRRGRSPSSRRARAPPSPGTPAR